MHLKNNFKKRNRWGSVRAWVGGWISNKCASRRMKGDKGDPSHLPSCAPCFSAHPLLRMSPRSPTLLATGDLWGLWTLSSACFTPQAFAPLSSSQKVPDEPAVWVWRGVEPPQVLRLVPISVIKAPTPVTDSGSPWVWVAPMTVEPTVFGGKRTV